MTSMDAGSALDLPGNDDKDLKDRPSFMSGSIPIENQYADLRSSLAEQVMGTRMNLLTKLEDEVVVKTEQDDKLGVFLRIRPTSSGQTEDTQVENSEPYYTVDATNRLLTVTPPPGTSLKSNLGNKFNTSHVDPIEFEYSQIFGVDTGQAVVYDRVMAGLTEAAVRGQNALLFAYGVTSSGKTYTIQGTDEQPGLIPRALESMFSLLGDRLLPDVPYRPAFYNSVKRLNEEEQKTLLAQRDKLMHHTHSQPSDDSHDEFRPASVSSMSSAASIHDSHIASSHDHRFIVYCSFVEIYNNYVYDLLVPYTSSKTRRQPLKLGEDKEGSTYVKGLSEFPVFNAAEATSLFNVGQKNLRFGSTSLNVSSSRSHCIFTVRLMHVSTPTIENEPGTVALMSRLSVCDLAGSERSRRTNLTGSVSSGSAGTGGAHIRETGSINTSLSVLRQCIASIRHNQIKPKNQHKLVPYRDSHVTRVLQSFFVGGARINMIVNIHPGAREFDETMHVLKFSSQAKRVHVKPGVSREPKQLGFDELQALKPRSARQTMEWKELRQSIAGAGANNQSIAEEGDEEEDEMDVYVQQLQTSLQEYKDYSHKLKSLLIEEKRKNKRQRQQIEQEVRDEVCGEYTDMIRQMEDEFSRRQMNMQTMMEELSDRRIQLYVNSAMKHRARHGSASDTDYSDDMDNEDEESETSSGADEDATQAAERTPKSTSFRSAVADDQTPLAASHTRPRITVTGDTQIIQKLEADMKALTADLREAEKRLEKAESVRQRLSDDLKAKEQERQELEDMLTEAGQQFTNQEKLIADLRAELADAKRCATPNDLAGTKTPEASTPAGTPNTVVRLRNTTKTSPNGAVPPTTTPSPKYISPLPPTNPYHRPTSVVVVSAPDDDSPGGFVSAYSHLSSTTDLTGYRSRPLSSINGTSTTSISRFRKTNSPYKCPEFRMTRSTAKMLTRATTGYDEEEVDGGGKTSYDKQGQDAVNTSAATSVWSTTDESSTHNYNTRSQYQQHHELYTFDPPTVDGRSSPQPMCSTLRDSVLHGPDHHSPGIDGLSAIDEGPHREDSCDSGVNEVKILLNDDTVLGAKSFKASVSAINPGGTTHRPSTNQAVNYYKTHIQVSDAPPPMVVTTLERRRTPKKDVDNTSSKKSASNFYGTLGRTPKSTSQHHPTPSTPTSVAKCRTLPVGRKYSSNRAFELRSRASPSIKHNHDTGSMYWTDRSSKDKASKTDVTSMASGGRRAAARQHISRFVKKLTHPSSSKHPRHSSDVFDSTSASNNTSGLRAHGAPSRHRLPSKQDQIYSRKRRSFVKMPKLRSPRSHKQTTDD